jgi:benzoate/toluate 1,2-dioxygenase beta subunit
MTISYESVRDFLYREARHLDDKQWDSWLEMYAADATFWMPSWDDNDELTQDPQREISLIWYGRRDGNIELLEQGDGLCQVRFNWHTLSFRYKTVDSYFGTSFYTLDIRGDQPLIKAKKVVLKNDYVRQVIDIYHI